MLYVMYTGEKRVIGKPREVVGQRKTGELVDIQLLLNEVKDEATGTTQYIAVLNDVTKMKQLIEMNKVSELLGGGFCFYTT